MIDKLTGFLLQRFTCVIEWAGASNITYGFIPDNMCGGGTDYLMM
jgi:hypothetical protein